MLGFQRTELNSAGASPPSAKCEDGRITMAAARQVQNVSVPIGGIDAIVEYAGAAPGLVSGAPQINVLIPESLIGGTQPAQITVGVLATQEISNSESAALLQNLRPGGESALRSAFLDATDSMRFQCAIL